MRLVVKWSVVTVLLVLLPGQLAHPEEGRSWKPWDIIEVSSGRTVALDEWVGQLADMEVVYLGEEHRNHWHIDAALKIMDELIALGRRPALAIEMFGWDGQAALTSFVHDRHVSREDFLRGARWQENWGGAFEDYEPLIASARRHRLDVLALNPPRTLVRKVATQGLERALSDDEAATWRMRDETFVRDAAYRDTIVDQLKRCHGGLPDDGYERMYEASLFRDEGMARTVADAVLDRRGEPSRRPVVSYTGGGHIQYQLPVPNRVRRRVPDAQQVTVYLMAVPEAQAEIESLVRAKIADYVWLTPVGALGPAKRCR